MHSMVTCGCTVLANHCSCLQHCGNVALTNAGEQLLADQGDAGLRSILTAALTKVMSANGLSYSLDRSNKQVFRDNLGAFVVDARSIVRVR